MIYLKIFSGSQVGAKLALEANQLYNIGFDENLDIIFHSHELKSGKFTLYCNDDNTVTINNIDNLPINNLLNKNPIINENYITNIPLFLQIVDIDFAIGELDDIHFIPINDDKAPDSLINDEDAEINTSIDIADNDELNIIKETFLINILQKINKISIIIIKLKELWHKIIAHKLINNKIIKNKYTLIVLILLTAIVTTSVIIIERKKTKQQIYAAETLKYNTIKNSIINKMNHLIGKFNGLKLIPELNNKYIISGVIENKEELLELKQIFKPELSYINFNVIERDIMLQQIETILSNHQLLYLSATYDIPLKQLTIHGVLDHVADINDVLIDINTSLPMIYNIDTMNIFAINDIKQDFQDVFVKNNFTNSVMIKYDWAKSGITLQGYLSKSDTDLLKELITNLVAKYQNIFTINYDMQDISNVIPFAISEVYTGNPSYIATLDGHKIFVGGSYQGVTLKHIANDTITLMGKFPIIINLNNLNNIDEEKNDNNTVTTDPNDGLTGQVISKELSGNNHTDHNATKKLNNDNDEKNAQGNLLDQIQNSSDIDLDKLLNERLK